MVAVRTLLVAILALSVVTPSVAVGVADVAGSESAVAAESQTVVAAESQASIAGTQIDADDVLLAAELQENGDAEWRIEYRIRLDDENATAGFESLQQDIEQNPENYTQSFRDRMVATATNAEASTGREMAIENVSVSAETRQLPREYGVVTYRFTWTGFAVVEGGQLRAGDALAGLFLDAQTTLLLTWPEGYQLDSVDPSPDDRSERSVSWSGPREFTGEQPSVQLASNAVTSQSPIGLLPLILLGALLVAIGLVAVWYRKRSSEPPSGPDAGDDRGDPGSGAGGAESGGTTAGTDDESVDAGTGDAVPSDGSQSDATESSAGATADSDVNSGSDEKSGSGSDSDSESDSVPEELLSNEERVLQLLEANGGRMKQQQVVQELDWTEAKTSQVVSTLREDDQIETFRIGRENVLTLPGEDEL